MTLQAIYLETPPECIAYIKFIFESYEGIGIIRTVERKRAVVVLLAMDDFIDTARKILDSIRQDIPLAEIPRPSDITDDWFMTELATESSEPQT